MLDMKARVREVFRWLAVAIFGWVGTTAFYGALTDLNFFVTGVIIGGVCLLAVLLLVAYRPPRA
jgi:hypothetical protein